MIEPKRVCITILSLCLVMAMNAPMADEQPPLRILFVGNSLTFWENVPGRVQRLSDDAGIAITVGALTKSNYSIEMHMKENELIRKLREGWDIVVLQQGPSSTAEGRSHLHRWATRAGSVVRRFGAEPVFYSPWPTRDRRGFFDAVYSNYSNAAIAADSCVLPVTRAWIAAIQHDLEDVLYARDRQHASPAGAELAAQVIAYGLLGVLEKEVGDYRALVPFVEAAYQGQMHACDAEKLRIRISGDTRS